MDQLFVSERAPSPTSSASIHGEEEHTEGRQEAVIATPKHGKQPEASKSRDGPELSYAQYRARRKSSLAARKDVGEHLADVLPSHNEEIGEGSADLARRDVARRPTLSSRSTEERSTQNQGLLWDGAAVDSLQQDVSADLYTTEDGDEVYRQQQSRRSPERPSDGTSEGYVPRRYSRAPRPHSYAAGMDQSGTSGHRSFSRSLREAAEEMAQRESSAPEVAVPRWQPDAEVTFCPICRTQFSFFVRKHHCRKCGRVVCNACSPHRITIPHQYIVQPPTDPIAAAVSRPSIDAARARSSTVVESLGGGERVRLCNPCVPDPNVAPPQTRSDGQPISGHSRSQSTVLFSPSRRGDLDIPTYRARDGGRESGVDAQVARDRYWAATGVRQPSQGGYGIRTDSLVRPEALESRSRSSTVGSQRILSQSSHGTPRGDGPANFARSYHALSPHSQANLSRPLPNTPQPQRHTTQRRRIREEDQCWLCFRELPSRELPNSEELRSAHVIACLESATVRASGSPSRAEVSPPPPPPPPVPPNEPVQARSTHTPPTHERQPSIQPSRLPPQPVPTPEPRVEVRPTPQALSTPESRMQARERQHAAIVLGQSASGPSSASAMSRVIPYIASEKDGIDDAECMICMEEFEVGQEMGRLECFCRFHLGCIKGWFERKAGKCPVHGGDFF